MATSSTTAGGLTRVTVIAPDRRLDVVLPANAAVAEVLPAVAERAGDGLGDRGESHGGWRLTTETGAALAPDKTLEAQGVVDGRCLYLVPGDVEWPEPDYDDVVEAIADSSRRRARNWSAATTRVAGVAGAAALLGAGLVQLLRADLDVVSQGWLMLAVGSVLLLAGVMLSRAWSDARAGCVVAVMALAHLLAGGMVITSPPGVSRFDIDGIDLLVGSTALSLGGVIAGAGVVWGARLFVAAIVAGLAGVLGGSASLLGASSGGCAAVVVSVLTGAVAIFPLWAMRFGRVPVPALPRDADDVLADAPRPDPVAVRDAVLRADEILTGLLAGASVAVLISQVVLVRQPGSMPVWLAAVVAAVFGLRSQLFPTVRHKVGLLLVAVGGVVALTLEVTVPSVSGVALLLALAAVLGLAGGLLGVAVRYSSREVSPYVPRIVDIIEIVLVVAVLPLAGAVLGLYAFGRGLAG